MIETLETDGLIHRKQRSKYKKRDYKNSSFNLSLNPTPYETHISRIRDRVHKSFLVIVLILVCLIIFFGFKTTSVGNMALRLSPQDPNSYARADLAKVVDINLQLEADFEKKILFGNVTLSVEKVDPLASQVLLDSRELVIEKVQDGETGENLDFKLHKPGYVGSKLEVNLPKNDKKLVKLRITYATSSSASALQWLQPEQTAGKTHPYLFSQCQAIHCRSMVPLQDTPSVKSPYSAEIIAPSDLTVLMSAVRQGDPETIDGGKKKKHRFIQKIPIQSYLIAIAAGRLESRKIGPRSHVWSEKEFVDKAAKEFEDTESMLKEAEDLCGPYVWEIYDILVLPPSFPYGGMENPCLTFATPTLLTGDKSLANVIAHEIAHSWTGNLVTNKNFEHFWLNEGFTVFTERKIVGRLSPQGEAQRSFQAISGWKDLEYSISVQGANHRLTSLVVDLNGIDPDDAFSVVPYEKGSAFLWYLEDTVGGPSKMEPFLKSYYEKFKFQSIDSYQFKAYFEEFFQSEPKIKEIKWKDWLEKPGMPIYKPRFDESLAQVSKELREKWIDWSGKDPVPFSIEDLIRLNTGQRIEFLSLLLEEKEPLSVAKLMKMNELYKLSEVTNTEIQYRWVRLGILAKWEDAVPWAIKLVSEQGRMKFLRPIYRDLYNWEEKRSIAISTFLKNRPSMMQVAVQGLAKDLHLNL